MNISEAFSSFFKKKEDIETTENPNSHIFSADMEADDRAFSHFRLYNRANDRKKKSRDRNISKIALVEKTNSYIRQWRSTSFIPEVSEALEDITNTILSSEDPNTQFPPLDIDTDSGLDKTSQKKIEESYKKVMRLMKFDEDGYNIVMKYLIDGRQQAEILYKESSQKADGVIGINFMSPYNLTKLFDDDGNEVYQYVNNGSNLYSDGQISKYGNAVAYKSEQFVQIEYPTKDPITGIAMSVVHKAVKPGNNLSQIEDSMILVRFMKGMMLRLWNVNVGRLPASKAQTFLKQVSDSINHDISYDNKTGEFKTKKNFSSLFQDIIFPTRSANDITSVETVDGDTALLEGSDHELFLKKLYKSMHIPVSRLSDTPTIEFDSLDLLKDEQTFMRFTDRLRTEIKKFIFEIMKRDLIVQGIVKEENWDELSSHLSIKWSTSSSIIQRANMELWNKRSETLADLKDSGILGNVVSYDYAYRNVLGLSSQEIEQQKELIKKEKKENPDLYKQEED